ncbi:hypothetical protein [Maridesulfovibrio sp.]|uniref:hypothetical protein n=1 Tax=Maridesulfovibrio sp. TaxID=2795000 RepID=UPI0029CA72DF|nr:hypothetical protein [Maridesulfovibrio sp.]
MELFERINQVIETFYDGKSSHLAAAVRVPANTFNRQISKNNQQKISLHLLFQILEKTPEVCRDWLFFGEGGMLKSQTESLKSPEQSEPEQTSEAHPAPPEVSDPISQRILITTQALEKAGASQEKIQDAIMAILKPGTTYTTGDDRNSWRERKFAAEQHTEYEPSEGKGKDRAS